MVIFRFFKLAAVHHLGFVMSVFGPPTKCIWWSFITVQYSVGIDAVVLIICMFFDFTILAGKRLLTPPKLFSGGFTPKWAGISTNPQNAHPWAERIDRQNRSTGATCVRDEETKKRKTKTETQQWQTWYSPRPRTSWEMK